MSAEQAEQVGPLHVIGWLQTPFKDSGQIPVQGTTNSARGTVTLLGQYAAGADDLAGFDRVWLIYYVPSDDQLKMRIVPKLDDVPHGVFATRSLLRPNPIGLTSVKLLRVEGATLHVEGVDMLDGVALLDLKPYVPRYDAYRGSWAGWLENRIPHEAAWRDETASPR